MLKFKIASKKMGKNLHKMSKFLIFGVLFHHITHKIKSLMNNQEIRSRYESGNFLTPKQVDQISKDIFQTAESQNVEISDEKFLKEFWANYFPADDGHEFVRTDEF